jgi:tape measure domain-containing protein
MAETHELRLKIDAAAAKRGGKEFSAAIRAIIQNVRDLERTSTGTFAKLQKSIKDTAKTAGGSKLRFADATMKKELRDIIKLHRDLNAVMRRSRDWAAKTSTEMKNLSAAYKQVRGSSRQALTPIQGYQQTTKLLVQAIRQLSKVQAAQAQQTRALSQQQRATSSSARALERDMRAAGSATSAASRSFREATGSLRGLENAFSGTYQAGSLFRTLLGSITFGTFTQSVYQAGNALDQFRVTMQVASDTEQEAAENIQFVSDLARDLGTSLRGAREDFSKFAVSSDIAGVSAQTTRDIFSSVAMAMSVLGKGAEDQRLAFMALEQMMSKGKVSSEELRRQLGERLPGAVNIMAKALNVTTGELQDLLKAGAIDSADALPKFAQEVRTIFGPGFQSATQRAGYNIGTFRNEIEFFLETAAQSGLMQELAVQFRELTDVMRSGDAQEAARLLGRGFADAARIAGDALQFIVQNIEELGRVAKAIFTGVVIRQSLLMSNALVSSAQRMVAFTAAMGSSSVAAASYQAGMASSAVATGALGAQAATTTTQLTGLAAAQSRLGALSRGLSAFAGPAGLAFAGLSLLPMLFRETSVEAERAASDYEDAMLRMGTSSLSFITRAREVNEASDFDKVQQNISDLIRSYDELDKLRRNESIVSGALSAADNLEPFSLAKGAQRDALTELRQAAAEFVTFGGSIQEQSKLIPELSQAFDLAFRRVPERSDEIKALDSAIQDFFRTVETGARSQSAAEKIAGPEIIQNIYDQETALRELQRAFDVIFTGQSAGGIEDTPLGNLQELLNASGGDMLTLLDNLEQSLTALAGTGDTAALSFLQSLRNQIESFSGSRNDLTELRDTLRKVVANLESSDLAALSAAGGIMQLIDAAEGAHDALDAQAAAADAANATLNNIAGAMAGASAETRGLINEVQGLISALHQIPNIQLSMRQTVQGALDGLNERIRLAGITDQTENRVQRELSGSDALQKLRQDYTRATELLDAQAGSGNPALQGLRDEVTKTYQAYQDGAAKIEDATRRAIKAEEAQRKSFRKGSRGGGGTTPTQEVLKDRKRLVEETQRYIAVAQAEYDVLALQATGQLESARAVEFLAESMALGRDMNDEFTASLVRQIEEVERVKEAMLTLANDPVKAWMDSVPGWLEAGQVIEKDVVQSLSDTISNFIQTGELDFRGLASSIISSMADVMADQAVNWLLETFGRGDGFGLGGFLQKTFGKQDSPEGQALSLSSQVAGQNISAAMINAGQVVSQQIQSAMVSGGTSTGTAIQTAGATTAATVGAQVQTAGTIAATNMGTQVLQGGTVAAQQMHAGVTAGGANAAAQIAGSNAGGGFLSGGGLLGIIAGFFSEGGYSNKPVSTGAIPVSAFMNAPAYAEGTANTSGGMPAILHDNEAVVPLSRGRKIPVDLSGSGGMSGISVSFGDINVSVETGGDIGTAEQGAVIGEQIAATIDYQINEKLSRHLQYGGMLSPRGGA